MKVLVWILALACIVRLFLLTINMQRHPSFFNPPPTLLQQHLRAENKPCMNPFGYEISNVACSIVCKHEGFSSPFGGSTGPTGWVAPGMVFLYALGFKLFGCFTKSSILFMFGLSTGVSLLIIVLITAVSNHVAPYHPATGRIAALLYACCPQELMSILYPHQTDFNIPTFWFILIFYLFLQMTGSCRVRDRYLFALAGGSALLFSPVMALPIALCLAVYAMRHRTPVLIWDLLVCLLIITIIIAPYMVYQKNRMGHWFFIKSNGPFEIALGNNPEFEGVLVYDLFQKHHPGSNTDEFIAYRTMGEINYIKDRFKSFASRFDARNFLFLTAKRFIYFFFLLKPYIAPERFQTWRLVAEYIGYAVPGLTLLLYLLIRCKAMRWQEYCIFGYIFSYALPYLCAGIMYRYAYPISSLTTVLLAVLIAGSGTKKEKMMFPDNQRHGNPVRIFTLLCAIIFGLSLYVNFAYFFRENPQALAFFPPFIEGVNLNHNTHLGAEYFFIAQAIASGKGFSNPFQVDTGPTAWMPPLYCYLLALLIFIGKKKIIVAGIVVLLKNIVLIGVGMMLYRISAATTHRIPPWFVIVIYLLFLLAYFRWFFQMTHDEWILLLFVCAVFVGAVLIMTRSFSLHHALLWGGLGGSAMLVSPILGSVWGITTVFLTVKTMRYRHMLISLLLCGVLCLPWIVRNYLVFNKVIFIKSNFYFDLYTSNYETEDGLHKESVVLRQHPVWNLKQDRWSEYYRYGEAAFIDLYKQKFFAALSKNPGRYVANIKNRIIAALLHYPCYGKYEKPSLFKTIVHALPFLGLIAMVGFGTVLSPWHKIAILIYCAYLIPYMFVGYYIRYSIPLTGILCLFVLWGADVVCERCIYYVARSTSSTTKNRPL